MKKILFRILKLPLLPFFVLGWHRTYMHLYIPLLKFRGIRFTGKPRYIGYNVKLDYPENIVIGENVVISDESIILTHDYSINNLAKLYQEYEGSDLSLRKKVILKDHCFIGKRSIIMPGAEIGSYSIIGAGAVVRGKIDNETVMIGNPAKAILSTKELWNKHILKKEQYFND